MKPIGRPARPNHLDRDHQDADFHDNSLQSRDRPRHQQLRDGAGRSRRRSTGNCANPPVPGGQPVGREGDPGLRAVPATPGGVPAEAVRKPREFLQTIAQSEIFRDFFASKRSEGSKK